MRSMMSDARRSPAVTWVLVVVAGVIALRSLRSGLLLGLDADVGPKGDLSVYLGALHHLHDGGRLYEWQNAMGFGFTYPPFAALVLQPLTWASPALVGRIWVVTTLALAVVIGGVVALSRPVDRASSMVDGRPMVARLGPARWAMALAAIAVFVASSQVQSDLITGQVNLVIAALVLIDLGGLLPARLRGIGVGLAAAIKSTPVIAIGWLVATRQWAAAARAAVTFAVCVALGWLVLPDDSAHYWLSAVFDVGRVGDVDLRFNASVMGLLAGLGLDGTALRVGWLLLGAVVVLVGWWQAARVRRDDAVAAAIVVMLTAVAASPISWPHHQIWVPLAGIVLICRPGMTARVVGAAVLVWSCLHVPAVMASDAWGHLTWLTNRLDHVIVIGCCLLGLGRPRSDLA